MRDYASLNELLVLSNMESYNAVLISKGMEQKERMTELRKLARTQLLSLEKLNVTGLKSLEDTSKNNGKLNFRQFSKSGGYFDIQNKLELQIL